MIPPVQGTQDSQVRKDRKQNGGYQGLQKGETGSCCLKGACRVSVWDDEKVPQMESGDDYTTVKMHLMLQNCTLKVVNMVTLTSILPPKKTNGMTLRYMSTMEEAQTILQERTCYSAA